MTIPLIALDLSLRNAGIAIGQHNPDTGQLHIDLITLVETEKTTAKQVRKNSDDLRCCREIHAAIQHHRNQWRPLITIAEIPSGTQSARASWALGTMLGIIATLPHPVVEVSPTEVKKHWAGRKDAGKDQMIQLAVERYPDLAWLRRGDKLLGKNEHMADAVAVMSTGVQTVAFRELTQMLRHAAPQGTHGMAGTP